MQLAYGEDNEKNDNDVNNPICRTLNLPLLIFIKASESFMSYTHSKSMMLRACESRAKWLFFTLERYFSLSFTCTILLDKKYRMYHKQKIYEFTV